ncbi:MAG TPA: RidA family protein [Stellaceae bacterium]|jgi:enamine deaminase RidA (YjgF/YER057c/UK114 family)|nr:RidA family protein [Stellaceae bacterium]
MKRRHVWPDGHWAWPIEVTHKHGLRSGQMIWIGGQVDLTSSGEVLHQGALWPQISVVIGHLQRVLEGLDAEPADLVKLLCFYVNDGSVDETRFLEAVAAELPEAARPAVTAVPVPYLAYPGMMVEIEAYAMRGEDGRPLPRQYASTPALSPLPARFAQALRCGKMIFVSGQSPVDGKGELIRPGDIVGQTNQVMKQVGAALAEFGAGFDDVVKVNRWYAGQGTVADFEPAALACARHFLEPGPAATGVPIPRHARPGQEIKIEAVAMLGEDGRHLPRRHSWPDGLWDWHVHLPYKHGLKCEEMIFLGGQVALDQKGNAVRPGELTEQTRQAMAHIGTILRDLGADYEHVCKVTTVYAADSSAEELHANLAIRSSFFRDPGPATTGIPLPKLAYPGMMIEIDVFAMVERDSDAS